MPETRRRKSPPMTQPLLRRLDHAAEQLNPILLLIIVGLGILNFSVFAALEIRKLPLRPLRVPGDATATALTAGLPQR